jgi:hypothetical protein
MHLELYKSKGINPRTDEFTFSCLQSTSFPWQVYLLVCTVNKFSLTSLLSRVYSQQVFLDKFTFLCVRSTNFPWQVYFLVCTVNKFSLTSLLSCVYGPQIFLDKFTFSCVQSTSFPWQVYFLVCTVHRFSLTSLLSRVYDIQVLLDKFTFSCVRYTSSPWQVYFLVCTVNKFSLTSFVATACKHLFYVKPAFILVVFLYTCQVFLADRIPDEQIFLSKTCCEYIYNFGKENLSIFCRTHEQIKLPYVQYEA